MGSKQVATSTGIAWSGAVQHPRPTPGVDATRSCPSVPSLDVGIEKLDTLRGHIHRTTRQIIAFIVATNHRMYAGLVNQRRLYNTIVLHNQSIFHVNQGKRRAFGMKLDGKDRRPFTRYLYTGLTVTNYDWRS